MCSSWPSHAAGYLLGECIGGSESGASTARIALREEVEVAVKIVDLEKQNSHDLSSVQLEIKRMMQLSHRNLAQLHAAFVSNWELWLVMQYHAAGSCWDVMRYAHPKGLQEVVVLTILREVVVGLDYLHGHGTIHRHLKSSNILIDAAVRIPNRRQPAPHPTHSLRTGHPPSIPAMMWSAQ